MKNCKIKSCNGIYKGLGYCNKHYKRFRFYGDPEFTKINERGSGNINKHFYDNFNSFKDKVKCWIYPTKPMENGYVTICAYRTNGKQMMRLVHRLSYQHHYKKKILKGMHIDHICRVRNCFNPHHLRMVTPSENFRCSSHQSVQPFCKRGHKRTKENRTSVGGCRECSRLANLKRRKDNIEVFRMYDQFRHIFELH